MILAAEMERYFQSIMVDVVIAAAGSGTRMQAVVPGLHKGLLPYKTRPIIWYLVNQIPDELEIAVLLGFKSEQIQDFLELAFPARKIKYIQVDDWESEKSGTGYSLLQAENFLANSFWYLPCDGLISDLDYIESASRGEDCIFTKKVMGKDAAMYTWFSYSNETKLEKNFKVPSNADSVLAFTGIMRINDKTAFFERLRSSRSKEFIPAISEKSLIIEVESWQDFGSPSKYNEAIRLTGNFNFAKQNEITFELPDFIIKWWSDQSIPQKKLAKPAQQQKMYPDGLKIKSQFLGYKKVAGESLYNSITPDIFSELLQELKSIFWVFTPANITEDVFSFYQVKTNERLALMLRQGLGNLENVTVVNSKKVRSWQETVDSIDFESILDLASTSTIHGDLQFDNVIYNENFKEFKLIDWRPTFGKQLALGDIYYDFAKLLGGIRMNYAEVKANNFSFAYIDANHVELSIPSAPYAETLEAILSDFVESMGFSFDHVKRMIPLIYLNMAPLHEAPFRELLWCKFLSDSQLIWDSENA